MSKIIHLLANNNITLIEFHILFNVNDKSVDNITELNHIYKKIILYHLYFINKLIKLLKNLIST